MTRLLWRTVCATVAFGLALHSMTQTAVAAAAGNSSKAPAASAVQRIIGPRGQIIETRWSVTTAEVAGLLSHRRMGQILRRSYVAKKVSSCLYLADYASGNVFVYDGRSLGQIGELTSPDEYGWGLAASDKLVYVGSYYDTIDEYAPCSGTTPVRTLTGNGFGYPYGVTVGSNGTVYADEWPSNVIDVWPRHGNHYLRADANESAVSFIAVDKNGDIFTAGRDQASNGVVDRCDSTFRTCVEVVSGVGFPGGIALDAGENLYVDDQRQQIVSEYTGCANPTPSCTLVGSASTGYPFTAITLDTADQHLLGAAYGPCGSSGSVSCGEAVRFRLPLQSGWVRDGFTPLVENATPLGITYWKPSQF